MYADYYPFGMQMPGRTHSAGDYRYGFGGQEKDDEIAENREKVDIEASTSFERWLNQENLMTRTMIENVALAEKAKEEAEKQRLAEAEALANADSDDDD